MNKVTGSGEIISTKYTNTDFTSIEVNNTCQLEIIQGSEYSITILCDDNIHDNIIVKQSNNKLKISLNRILQKSYYDITFNAIVTMPELTHFKLSQASSLIIDKFDSSISLIGELSQASKADIQFNTTKNIQIKNNEASKLIMIGNCNNLILSSSGACETELSELYCKNATINLTGVSNALVRLNGELKYNLSGVSSLTTYGNITSVIYHDITGMSQYRHSN